jgi:putative glycerol-1-phosphate prenyltransferase
LLKKNKHTQLVVLIDPDKYNPALVKIASQSNVSFIFVGGSALHGNTFEKTIKSIKSLTDIPVIIFPGDENQVSKSADGILILSLLSGRNPEYLIGKVVKVASKIKSFKLQTVPVGYILIQGFKKSTTQKVTKTLPLNDRKEIINTCIAAELIGKKAIYLEAGSGAREPLTPSLIRSVKKNCSLPLIVGGGIDTVAKAKKILASQPDYIVIGNAFEKNPELLIEISHLFE